MKPKKNDFTFTSESVSEGHPDKVCDRVSDSIVDLFLSQDPQSRAAIECLATTNRLIIAGETRAIRSVPSVFIDETAREAIHEIGYEQEGFNWRTVEITNLLHAQSPDIAMGVDEGANKEEGAGDQGIMFGYAIKEDGLQTNLMPAPIFLANRILENLSVARREHGMTELLPDAKSQVTLLYSNGVPVKAAVIVVSTQHQEYLSQSDVREIVRPHVMKALPDPSWFPDEANFLVNPTGRFVIGGPDGDTGMTGRKIIIDTYGGSAPHGGGAFSGKDPTKVDRSAAYMARYIAKNVVAAGLADECLIQVSYAIGVSRPLSFFIDTNGTGRVDEARITAALLDMVPLNPKGIRTYLDLNKPIYKITSSYGHFGREPTEEGHFSWERVDLAEKLKGLL